MDQRWTPEDQGLLEALQLLDHLQRYNQFPSSMNSSPLPLMQGERALRTTSARALRWQRKTKVQPEEYHYLRLRVKWSKDPLMAPFLWLLLLPFNIISMLIARPRATKDHDQWIEAGSGPLVVTDRAILQAISGGMSWLRIPWVDIRAVGLTANPGEISLTWEDQSFFFYVPEEDRLWVYVASRYMAFNDTTVELPRPTDFINRARYFGHIP